MRKNNFSIFLSFFLLFIGAGSAAFSQSCANYTPTRTTGISYTSIAGTGTSNFVWRNTASNQNDDNRSYPVSIGFDFWYLGVRYTTFSAALNGFIDFSTSSQDGNSGGAQPYGGNYNNWFSRGNGTHLTLAPMHDDPWTGGGGTAPVATSIFYKVSGAAPNRVLTVEFLNFDKWPSSTGSLNYQVKIYETTGVIEFIYGTMTAGSAAFAYSCGINSIWTTTVAPTAAQLLTQQTANTTTFNNTPKNNLTTLPSSNSQLTFTPPTPTAAPTLLSFTAVTQTGMTLNWTDNATNEVGYVIYNSTDGANYSFVTQVAANAVSAVITGLYPSTTYYWQVYAVTEGRLSAALTGTQATLPALKIISIVTGNWNTTTTWDCTCIPTPGDSVIIADGTVVTLDANGTCYSLTVGQGVSGQLIIGNDATARSLTVSKDVRILSGATMTTGATAATHSMSMGGNLTNNAVFNLAPTSTRVCNITFNKNGNQTISGSGATTNFHRITLNMGASNANVLDVASTNFTVLPTNFLTLTNGTFKLSTATATLTPFTTATTMTLSTGIWLNNAGASMATTGGTITLFGYIRTTAGTLTIGSASNNSLTSYGGTITIDGGALNIAGRLDRAGVTTLTYFTMSSGTLTVARVGSTTAGLSPFMISEVGSTFNVSGGRIIIERPGAGNLGYLNTGGTVGSVTGGTLQMGNASTPASQTMQINSSITVPNLLINATNTPTVQLITNPLTVLQNITISTGTTFNANNLNVTLGGNWLNNGGTYTPGTNTTTFNNSGAQSITKTTGETFNNLVIGGSGTKTLGGNIVLTGSLTISSTLDVSATPYNITLTGSWINNGTLVPNTGTVTFNGSSAQQISGSTATTFYNVTINNSSSGVTLQSPISVNNLLTLTNGRLHTTSSNILTMNTSSSSNGGNANSFVHGPMDKIGSTAFVFPIGYDFGTPWWKWARLAIGTPTAATTYRAEYFATPYANTTSMAAAPLPVLNNVSIAEYWTLDRTSGTGDATVTLYWEDAAASGIDDCSTTDLRVAHWNGSAWENNNDAVTTTGTCVGASAGTVTTSSVVTSFSPFTFGSKSSLVNPLPIGLVYFNAAPDKNKVNLTWQTATETNNDYFTVERSADGSYFESIDIVDGAGNSSSVLNYVSEDDNPYQGISYYRLKQTDFDGKYSYSNIAPVEFGSAHNQHFDLYPNPGNGENIHLSYVADKGEEVLVEIYDAMGKKSYSKVWITQADGHNVYPIGESKKLSPGIYLVIATSGQTVYSEKLVVK